MNRFVRWMAGVACVAVPLAATAQDVSLYSGTGAGSGIPVQAVFADQGAWEAVWMERLGGPPPIDLEGGLGVLVIPKAPGRYFTLAPANKGRSLTLRCVFHETPRVGGWAAAHIPAKDVKVSFEACP